MLVNTVVYTFPADKADEAARLLAELRDASRREPGCVAYDVSRGAEDPSLFVLHEVWADQAALELHLSMEHFIRLGINGIRTFATSRVAYHCTPLA
jgi:quinol monooxygenase YgiN